MKFGARPSEKPAVNAHTIALAMSPWVAGLSSQRDLAPSLTSQSLLASSDLHNSLVIFIDWNPQSDLIENKGPQMKKNILLSVMALLAGSLVAGESTPKDAVISAAKQLGQKADYSWKTTVVVPERARFRPGPVEGKTEKGEFTVVSGTFGDNSWEFVTKGDHAALKTPDGGWQSLAELEQEEGGGRFRAAMVRNFKLPAVQAADIAATAKDLKQNGDIYSGELTEEGAKALLTFRRRGGNAGPTVGNAKGSVRFWVRDGTLLKYEVKVKGTVSFNGNEFENDRTTTVEIRDVGTTKVEVPQGAKEKLN